MDEKKLEIIKELLVDEEHTLEDLRRLVKKSKPFIKIENKTGNIVILPQFSFTIVEKVILYFIGTYFSKEMGLNQDLQITSRKISESLDVLPTSLSGPLGNLVTSQIVSKDNESYHIKYYEIENQLDILTNKYLINKETFNEKQVKKTKEYSKSMVKRKKSIKKDYDKILKREFDRDQFLESLNKYNISEDEFNSIFNIDKKSFILLRGFKADSIIERHVRSTLLVIFANKTIYGQDEMDSSSLRRILENSGVDELTRLSTSLKHISNLIIHKRGPIGSTKTSYKINNLGIQKGIIIIKDILNNTKNFDLSFKSNVIRETAPPIRIGNEELMKNIKEFAKRNKIEEEKLKIAFDFQPDSLRLLIKFEEKIRKPLQIKSLMILGILLKKIYNIDSFDGKKLLKNSGISYDRLDLLDSNKKYSNYFSKGSKRAIKLTFAGEKQAMEMLRDLIKKNSCKL
jgi:hypothetical protein